MTFVYKQFSLEIVSSLIQDSSCHIQSVYIIRSNFVSGGDWIRLERLLYQHQHHTEHLKMNPKIYSHAYLLDPVSRLFSSSFVRPASQPALLVIHIKVKIRADSSAPLIDLCIVSTKQRAFDSLQCNWTV